MQCDHLKSLEFTKKNRSSVTIQYIASYCITVKLTLWSVKILLQLFEVKVIMVSVKHSNSR